MRSERDNMSLLERESVIPDPPEHLTKDEIGCWHEFAQVVAPSRVSTKEDFAAFEAMVTTFAEWRRARQEIRDLDGAFSYETTSRDGSTMHRAYPIYGQAADAERRLVASLARFGLTPSDRARIAPNDKDKPGSDPTGRKGKMKQFA